MKDWDGTTGIDGNRVEAQTPAEKLKALKGKLEPMQSPTMPARAPNTPRPQTPVTAKNTLRPEAAISTKNTPSARASSTITAEAALTKRLAPPISTLAAPAARPQHYEHQTPGRKDDEVPEPDEDESYVPDDRSDDDGKPINKVPGHFYPLYTWLAFHDEVTQSAQRVYGYLAKRLNRRDGCAWPKQETIASDLHMSLRSVRRAISDLERLKLVISRMETKEVGGWTKPRRKMFYYLLTHPWMMSRDDESDDEE